jgi:hypothetical protein
MVRPRFLSDLSCGGNQIWSGLEVGGVRGGERGDCGARERMGGGTQWLGILGRGG